jgi:hypothetical protein
MDIYVGIHGDVDALEVDPHRWRRVCKPPVREGVRSEQETEIVGGKGQWESAERENSEPKQKSRQADRRDCQSLAAGKLSKSPLDA